MQRPKIIDATLREGNQSPGTKFNVRQSVEVARMLSTVGVDMIECGHAAVGAGERERICALADLELSTPLLSHARAKREDIVAAKDSGADWVGIFCGINRISRLTRLRERSQESVLDMIKSSISFAKARGLKVRYTLEDASRTTLELVIKVLEAALAEGADRICYADTLGAMSPLQFGEAVRAIRSALPRADLELHIHDDRGFAIANALIGIEAGAGWISTAVNGIGERCGITDLAALLANLHLENRRALERPDVLQNLSAYVGAITRTPPDVRRPIVGKHAFTHTAKLHVDAVRKSPLAFTFFDAAQVGREIDLAGPPASQALCDLLVQPQIISATELKYHRAGPGARYVMIDERFVSDARQYCIVRDIPEQREPAASHVDPHRHICDSLFIFLGRDGGMAGLTVEVLLEGETQIVQSPAALFIPAGAEHSYRILAGRGLFINHVLAGDYNSSLLEVEHDVHKPNRRGQPAPNGPDGIQEFSQKVLSFLSQASGHHSRARLTSEIDLLESGVLDSVTLLQLLLFIEQLTGKSIDPDDLRTDAVRTVKDMYATFVERPLSRIQDRPFDVRATQ